MILTSFLFLSALLWCSVFGYLLVLAAIARRRGSAAAETLSDANCPPIAIVVPVLNEEAHIDGKLNDLQGLDYPPDRLRIVIVDGGSTDCTANRVRNRSDGLTMLSLEPGCGKAAQVNHALQSLNESFVVITDADSRLDPGCVRALVGMLVNDEHLAAVGAVVRPASGLVEERLHWWFLNYLWWLEGEVLSSAVFSGVCYGIRRSLVDSIPEDSPAEDAHLAIASSARGFRVRTCPAAHATELRVPQTHGQLINFRRRRGGGYAAEVIRALRKGRAPSGWRVAELMRLWHFLITPRLAAVLAVVAAWLLISESWAYAMAVIAAFGVPPLAALHASSTLAQACPGRWRLSLAFSRLVGLTWLSLLVLPRPALSPVRPQQAS